MSPTAADLRELAMRARTAATDQCDFSDAVVFGKFTNLRVRFSSGTHIVRGAGVVCSCTVSPAAALRAWAAKAEARAAELEASS